MWGNGEALAIAREAHSSALQAAGIAQQAMAAIDKHSAVCAERAKSTDDKIMRLIEQSTWMFRGIIVGLLIMVGSLVFEWIKNKGI